MAPDEAAQAYRAATQIMRAARRAFALARTEAEGNAARTTYNAAFDAAWETWLYLPRVALHRASHR